MGKLDLKLLKNPSRLLTWLGEDIWKIRLADEPPRRARSLRALRVVALAFQGFDQDKCPLRASALTFYTLMAVVPVAAMAFGVAKGFGFERRLERQLYSAFAGQEEIVRRVVEFSRQILENTRGGVLAGIGVVVLLWAVIKVLSHIERSFDDIWEVKVPRSMSRKFTNYLSIMLISPILIILSGSFNVFITTNLAYIAETRFFIVIGPLVFLVLKFLPYILMWGLLTFVYVVVPNTRVSITSGLLAAVAAGTLYQLSQWVYISLQVGVARYNAIYGSFAALPLFLIWLQLSWYIILLGAELSYAVEKVNEYEYDPECKKASHSFRKLASLAVSHLVVKCFVTGESPLKPEAVAVRLKLPPRFTRDILENLIDCGILLRTRTPAGPAYHPAIDVDLFTMEYVIKALEDRGSSDIPLERTEEVVVMEEALESFREKMRRSSRNRLLKEI